VLSKLHAGSPERRAVEAGEIDAVIDYASSKVILFPAAERALRVAAERAPAAGREAVANSLLVALSSTDYRRLLADMEPVTLRSGDVLHEPGEAIRYVYFPIDCAISILTTAADGRVLGAALVGFEGMIGIPVLLGVELSSVRAQVQATGMAMRIETARFRRAFLQCKSFQREAYRYTHSMLVQARETGACNSFHTAEARLARWFLLTSDRIMSKTLFLTQAFLAEMLGVRRVTVTVAAGSLQDRNLISYSRGRISILDRRGLEAAACECYTKIRSLRDTDHRRQSAAISADGSVNLRPERA
jgi:CRP-like cAMP-binding protein